MKSFQNWWLSEWAVNPLPLYLFLRLQSPRYSVIPAAIAPRIYLLPLLPLGRATLAAALSPQVWNSCPDMTTGWTAKSPQLPSHCHGFISHAVVIISLIDPLGFCWNVALNRADADCTASKKKTQYGWIDGIDGWIQVCRCLLESWMGYQTWWPFKKVLKISSCDFVIRAGFSFPELWHE